MSIKTSKILLVILIIAVLFYIPRPLFGCPTYFTETIFTYSLHPDFPLEKFARGELGILQPTYARSYLCVAYRYLIGATFDQEEQKAILALWDERLNRRWDSGEDWIKNWLDTRNKVPGVGLPPNIDTYRRYKQGYSYYFNYKEDAFRTAVRTLNERIEKFGADSPEVKDWVQAQDSVFGRTIPAPANPGMHPLIQADRAYQIAAAHFYQDTWSDLDVAEKMFRDIANDSSSPWRQIAPYLVARTLVRKATSSEPDMDEPDMDTLAQAEFELKKVLSDNSLNTIHPAAKRMLNFVLFRLRPPDERLHELAQTILQKNSGEILKQDLGDYTWLLDRFAFVAGDKYEQEQRLEELSGVRRKDDVTDWIFTFQSQGKDAFEHSIQRWSETLSLPWLVALLSKANIGHPKLPELLLAAGRVKQDSPAFPSVAFHTIRLMIESGRKEEAREKLDSLLSKDSLAFPPSSLNLFLAQRMKLARNLDKFLKYAPRVPAGIGYDYDEIELLEGPENNELKVFAGRALLDADSVNVLNEKMPLSLLTEAAKNRILPEHLRWGLALTTWVRSILLDNEAISKELVPILENLVPELKEFLNAYLAAENPEARKFAAVFLMLKFPGTRPYIYSGVGRLTPLHQIDNYRDNWWCFNQDAYRNWKYYEIRTRISEPLMTLYPNAKLAPPAFLDEAQKAAAKEEWEKLSSIGTAPNYLCQQVLEWAKRNHDDAQVPEALHLAVKSTRYGSTDKETSKFSKAAFQLLHKRYPKSIWAEKTPYWY